MSDFGRIVNCGAISTSNNTGPVAGPSNLGAMIVKRLRMQGFIVSDHEELRPEFEQAMRGWIDSGKVVWEETVADGIDQAVPAPIGLFEGENLGKMIVRLAAR